MTLYTSVVFTPPSPELILKYQISKMKILKKRGLSKRFETMHEFQNSSRGTGAEVFAEIDILIRLKVVLKLKFVRKRKQSKVFTTYGCESLTFGIHSNFANCFKCSKTM